MFTDKTWHVYISPHFTITQACISSRSFPVLAGKLALCTEAYKKRQAKHAIQSLKIWDSYWNREEDICKKAVPTVFYKVKITM